MSIYILLTNFCLALTVGDVSVPVFEIKDYGKVPCNFGNMTYGFNTPEILQHLQWMLKKSKLSQDMYLIGPPGPLKRWLAFYFCQITGREMEYISLTKDTSESDIKQRREISKKTLHYIDQAAVRAAINGRVLILDGIEKCERNVLPILNNLLENREMHLEDGRFLVSPKRYEIISKHAEFDGSLIPVHPDFVVVALGLPTPKFKGYPLDPPLRSRFQAREIPPLSEDTMYTILKSNFMSVEKDLILKLITFVEALNRLLYSENDAEVAKLWAFPTTGLVDVLRLISTYHDMSILPFILRVYPFVLMGSTEIDSVLNNLRGTGLLLDSSEEISTNDPHCSDLKSSTQTITLSFDTFEKSIEYTATLMHTQCPSRSFVMTLPLRNTIYSIVQDLLCGFHICLVGNQGSGKTRIIHKTAELLNSTIISMQLYKDLNSKDLIQQRSTDKEGNTIWIDSPLVEAARLGYWIILDNMHNIGNSTLSILQQILFDGELNLLDGRKLLSQDNLEHLVEFHSQKSGLSNLDSRKHLESIGIVPIHKSFRIIATATHVTKKHKWLNSELVSFFHYHILPKSGQLEQYFDIVTSLVGHEFLDLLKPVFGFAKDLNELKQGKDTNSELFTLSLRQLIRIAMRVSKYPEDTLSVIENTLLIQFAPTMQQDIIYELLARNGIKRNGKTSQDPELVIDTNCNTVSIGDIVLKRNTPQNMSLIPETVFYSNPSHMLTLYNIFKDWEKGDNLLLIGNQGVGKNVITDYFLKIMLLEREYIQLHRDTTVQSLTVSPFVENGVIVWNDSPLVRAVKSGRVLVIDEADKAPVEVVCIIKGLIEDQEMNLSDGRRISKYENGPNIIPMHPSFKMIMLANRPGFPFLGNNFFRECGDIFAIHVIDNPEADSEIQLLKKYGPNVDDVLLERLVAIFTDLRQLVIEGKISYPYSLRELVNIVKHMEAYPYDSLIDSISNVFHFDIHDKQVIDQISTVFQNHGIPFDASGTFTEDIAVEQLLPSPAAFSGTWKLSVDGLQLPYTDSSFRYKGSWDFEWPRDQPNKSLLHARGSTFTELRFYWKSVNEPVSVCADSKDFVYLLSSNPLQIIRYNRHCNRYTVLKLSNYLHTYYVDITLDLKSAHMNILKDDHIFIYIPSFNMSWVIGNKKIYVFEIPQDLNIFNAFGKKAYYNRNNIIEKDHYTINDTFASQNILYYISSTKVYIVQIDSLQMRCVPLPPSLGLLVAIHPLTPNLLILRFKDNISYFMDIGENVVVKRIETNATNINHFEGQSIINYETTNFLNTRTTTLQYVDRPLINLKNEETCEIFSYLRSQDKASTVYTIPLERSNQILNLKLKSSQHSYSNSWYSLEIINVMRKSIREISLSHPDIKHKSTSIMMIKEMTNSDILVLFDDGFVLVYQVNPLSIQEELSRWKKITSQGKDESHTINLTNYVRNPTTPKFGKIDPSNKPHVGGGNFAGGSGGADTAGLGGVGGFMRLHSGGPVYSISEVEKKKISQEATLLARRTARLALKEKLASIDMSEFDNQRYLEMLSTVKTDIKSLRSILESTQARGKERKWLKYKTQGELDDSRLVDGLVGEKNVYKIRGNQKPEFGSPQEKPKRIRFVMDVSGSMSRFNNYDGRLDRLLQCTLMIMESFVGFEDKFEYSIVGHSGDNHEILFVDYKKVPTTKNDRLKVLDKMSAHSSFCSSGDSTIQATDAAIKNVLQVDNMDEYFVFVFSDANLRRYGIKTDDLYKVITRDTKVKTHVIFIASPEDEAKRIEKELPIGKSHVCLNPSTLPTTFKNILANDTLTDN